VGLELNTEFLFKEIHELNGRNGVHDTSTDQRS
jgi:hypothetical protein